MPPNIIQLLPSPTTYDVSPDAPVRLDTVVGEQQKGTTLVEVDGVQVDEAETIGAILGKGKDLVGKTLTVTTTVTATNQGVLRTSVTYTLSGGSVPLLAATTRDAEGQNKTVSHFAEFLFKAAP